MAPYGAIWVPVACLSASSSAFNDAAASKSPNQTAIIAWPLSAIDSGASAPALRASSIWRVLTAFQLSKSQRVDRGRRRQHAPLEPLLDGRLVAAERLHRTPKRRARPPRAPPRSARASPSSSRSDGPSGRGAGGAALAARETRAGCRRLGQAAGEQRGAPRVEVRPAGQAHVERARVAERPSSSCAERLARRAGRRRQLARGAGPPGRAGGRRAPRPPRPPAARAPHRRRQRAGWRWPQPAPARRAQRRVAVSVDRPFEERGRGGQAAAGLGSPGGALELRGDVLVGSRRRQRPDARLAGRDRPADPSPRRAPGATARRSGSGPAR